MLKDGSQLKSQSFCSEQNANKLTSAQKKMKMTLPGVVLSKRSISFLSRVILKTLLQKKEWLTACPTPIQTLRTRSHLKQELQIYGQSKAESAATAVKILFKTLNVSEGSC